MSEKKTIDRVHIVKSSELEEQKGQGESKQLAADPFGNLYGDKGLVRPIYNMDHLLMIRESNPIHGSCIDAKVADIAGMGYQWVPKDGKESPSEKQQEELKDFLDYGNPEMTFIEILKAVWDDYETLGWGAMEVVTDGTGKPVELYHVPGHTLRAHRDRIRFAQHLNGTYRWFKKFGSEGTYDLETGEKREGIPEERQAGQIIVIRKVGSRSSYYGVPSYITALGTLVGSQAVRDYNIDFFSGKTIPDALLVLEGVDEITTHVEQELKAFFSAEVKGKHHKLAILPIPEGAKGKLEKVTPDIKEASFRLYRHDNAIEICVAHRVPPYRIGWPITGSLGGSSAKEMNEMYKRSVIEPGQQILEHRINRQLLSSFGELNWVWKINDIDLEDKAEEQKHIREDVKTGLLSPNEGRKLMGREPYKDGDIYYVPNTLHPTGQAALEPVIKADNTSDEEERIWNEWVGHHGEYEKKIQKNVADFFSYRRSAY